MPITEQERRELIACIENRMCKEYRAGEASWTGPPGAESCEVLRTPRV